METTRGANSRSYVLVKECPRCKNQDLRLKIKAYLDIPKNYFMRLSKLLIMEDDVTIEIDWVGHVIYCPECRWCFEATIPRKGKNQNE